MHTPSLTQAARPIPSALPAAVQPAPARRGSRRPHNGRRQAATPLPTASAEETALCGPARYRPGAPADPANGVIQERDKRLRRCCHRDHARRRRSSWDGIRARCGVGAALRRPHLPPHRRTPVRLLCRAPRTRYATHGIPRRLSAGRSRRLAWGRWSQLPIAHWPAGHQFGSSGQAGFPAHSIACLNTVVAQTRSDWPGCPDE
jgi:hypothetical protein